MGNKSLFIFNFRNAIYFILIFVIIGEIMVRLDIYFTERDNIIEVSDVKLNDNDSNAKILIFGDSFIYGGGLNTNKKTSAQLKKNTGIQVADLSRPSNNMIDNYNAFIHYIDSFSPKLVVLGYHINDILGGINMSKVNDNKRNEKESMIAPISKKSESYFKSILKEVYNSWESFRFVSSNLQNSLKVNYGLVLPGGDQHKISKELYKASSDDWRVSKTLLLDIKKRCKKRNINFVIILFVDFNTLKSEKINREPIEAITKFCVKNNINLINSREIFKQYNTSKIVISRYDGHANEFVHKELSDTIYKYYLSMN